MTALQQPHPCRCGASADTSLHPRHTSHRSRCISPQGDCDTLCRSVTAGRRSAHREGASVAWSDPRARSAARQSTGGARLTFLRLAGGKEKAGSGPAAPLSSRPHDGRGGTAKYHRVGRVCLYASGAAGPEWRRAPRIPTVALGQPPGQLLAGGLQLSSVRFSGQSRALLNADLCAGAQVYDPRAPGVFHGCKVTGKAAYR